MFRRGLAIAVAVGVFAVAAPPAGAVTALERKTAVALLDKINAKRVSLASVAPLSEWSFMSSEAEGHSAYMAATGDFSHAGFCDPGCAPSGAIDTRLERILNADTGGVSYVCENIAKVSGITDYKVVVRTMFKLWKNSTSGHRECMFDQDGHSKTWAGIGVKKKGKRTWYATFLAAEDSSPSAP